MRRRVGVSFSEAVTAVATLSRSFFYEGDFASCGSGRRTRGRLGDDLEGSNNSGISEVEYDVYPAEWAATKEE